MAIPVLSEEDMSLLQAIKPFLSEKSQNMLDAMVTVLNVFKPLQYGEGVDVDALASLMDMVHASAQAKKEKKAYVEVEKDLEEENNHQYESKDVENLLNLLSQNGKRDEEK